MDQRNDWEGRNGKERVVEGKQQKERRYTHSMPRKKFDRDAANRVWSLYTENLIHSISESEREGLDRGYSSYQIEQLWQQKVRKSTKVERKGVQEEKEEGGGEKVEARETSEEVEEKKRTSGESNQESEGAPRIQTP